MVAVRRLIALDIVVAMMLLGLVGVGQQVGAATPQANGQLAFGLFNKLLRNTQVNVINPDGTGQRLVQGPTGTGEEPRWFPDGIHVLALGASVSSRGSAIINVDDGTARDVGGRDPVRGCGLAPSPDGRRLLCEVLGAGSQNGIYTIRSSDGGGVAQITSHPGGDDEPGGWSPNGRRIVFVRFNASGDSGRMFVVRINGRGLRQITPAFDFSSPGRWSPQGNEIVFSQHVTPKVHSSIWVVHPDGTGLHEINVQPASACGGRNANPDALGCNKPAWSPDGTKIAFVRSHLNPVDGEIYIVNADGTGLTQVTHSPGVNDVDWGTHPPTG